MQKFKFNIRTAIVLHRIFQEKFMQYFTHMNYKLKGRYVCIRSMYLQNDPKLVFGKLIDVNQLADCLQFHLEVDGFASIQLVTLEAEDVIILFDANKEETEFTCRFIYWDDKYPPLPGINLKTLINISRLDKFQLKKYFEYPNYMLSGRNAVIRVMMIDAVDKDKIGTFVGMPNYGEKFPMVMVNYALGFFSSQKNIGRIDDNSENDLVFILFDKDGINPEFIYWDD